MSKPVSRPPPADSAGMRKAAERRIDDQLEQSFPASDPPGWTLGANDRSDPVVAIQQDQLDPAASP